MRTCISCGKTYEYCPSCAEFASEPKWKALFHDENCMNVFHAVSDYLIGEIQKEDAIKILKECDISNPGKYSAKIQSTLAELFPVEKKEPVKIKVNTVKRVRVENENNDV